MSAGSAKAGAEAGHGQLAVHGCRLLAACARLPCWLWSTVHLLYANPGPLPLSPTHQPPGDNNVMYLQTARYLVKAWVGAQSGKLPGGSASYLGDAVRGSSQVCLVGFGEDWRTPAIQLAALEHATARMAGQVTETLVAAGRGKLVFEGEPWNATTVDLIRLARSEPVGRSWLSQTVWRRWLPPAACLLSPWLFCSPVPGGIRCLQVPLRAVPAQDLCGVGGKGGGGPPAQRQHAGRPPPACLTARRGCAARQRRRATGRWLHQRWVVWVWPGPRC